MMGRHGGSWWVREGVWGGGLTRRYLGHTNRSRGKEYRPVANFLLSKRIDLDRRTKSEGYVSKSPISCKLPLGGRTKCVKWTCAGWMRGTLLVHTDISYQGSAIRKQTAPACNAEIGYERTLAGVGW